MFSHFVRKVLPFAWPGPRAGATTVRAGGLFWHVLPGADCVPDLAGWLADESAATVKHGPHRTVYRVALPGGTVFVKHCRVAGVRAWGREVLRPAKAKLEWENALALRDRGLPAVAPVAWGCRRPGLPGESYLVTRGLDGAVPFLDTLERELPTLPPSARRDVARELGAFMARMHDAGVAHPDPHPGNLLVTRVAGRPRFTLIDVHAVRIGRPLSWAESRDNLVLYNRWFQLRATRADRLRFWLAYVRGRTTLAVDAGRAAEVERGTLRSNLRFWAGRESRCRGSNRYFRKLKADPFRGFAVRDLPADVVDRLLADPDAAFSGPGVTVLKDSRTSTVAAFTISTPDGPRGVVFKRFNVRGRREPLKNLIRRSAALRSWVVGHSLRDRWLPTPRPLAVFHRVRRGVPREGYLLAELVPDAQPLPEAVATLDGLPAAERRRIVRLWAGRVARLVRTLHDHGGSHRDLKASNILLQGATADPASAVPVLVDLVGVRTRRPIPVGRRAKELARLNGSFLRSPVVTRAEKLRFLKAYLLASLRGGTDWKAWWRLISAATAAKVERNRRNGRPLA